MKALRAVGRFIRRYWWQLLVARATIFVCRVGALWILWQFGTDITKGLIHDTYYVSLVVWIVVLGLFIRRYNNDKTDP